MSVVRRSRPSSSRPASSREASQGQRPLPRSAPLPAPQAVELGVQPPPHLPLPLVPPPPAPRPPLPWIAHRANRLTQRMAANAQ